MDYDKLKQKKEQLEQGKALHPLGENSPEAAAI